MKDKPKKKKETHRVSLDINKSVWIAARQTAIIEDSTPKEVLEKKLNDNK